MESKAKVIAAIDVGTNSFHMVTASVNNRGILKIHSKEKEVVRLGSSSRDMKYLLPDAIERGVRTIGNFAKIAEAENAEVRAVATSAVREAENKDEFVQKVFDDSGVIVEVVSGREEGRLIYAGALHALPVVSKKTLVIDIGGGSTEMIVGYDGATKFVNSAKLGAIRCTKAFFPDGEVTSDRVSQCRDYIKGEWSPTLKRIIETGFEVTVGTSGTIQNIAGMTLAAKSEKLPDILNGLTVSRDDVLDLINTIANTGTIAERAAIPGMDPKRADIIVGGALILERALISLNIQKLFISSYALREGIVFDTVQKKKAIQEFPHLSHLRYETVRALCRQYNADCKHSEHVRQISMQLFDGLQSVHNLGYPERELLEAASLLHDVGYHISHDQHHKHSHYIISHCMMPGFTNDESELIANIARYHRKSHPKKKHVSYNRLSRSKQETVKILSGILRIAEGIDRRQIQTVKGVKTVIDNGSVKFQLIPSPDSTEPDIELWGAKRRKMLLEEALHRAVDFDLMDG